MTRETYRGVKLTAQKLKGRGYGKVRYTISGVPWGEWIGASEEDALVSMRRTVDEAFARPDAYPPYWRGEVGQWLPTEGGDDIDPHSGAAA